MKACDHPFSLRFALLAFLNILLVLFFLYIVLGAILPQRGLGISLPKVLTSAPVTGIGRVVVIRQDGRIFLDRSGSPVDAGGLDVFFREAAAQGRHILIKADDRAQVKTLVRVWDAARRAGVAQISIATNE
ncbi:MAG: biopolymer transporter ExbD [Candidatus Omnitrophica bacterium]|nr:biopolymer transporter ExbD [Candidatus Omnitrophota bacterium]MDD5575056.1 biopolymer transporter ExbD [Candidatus Omnitrophota bacterium]